MRQNTVNHKMKATSGVSRVLRGLTLAEMLAALTIGAMVIVAVLGIYRRAEKSAEAVTHKLNSSRVPGEVLQRIAEDLDSVISASSDATITIENKFENIASTMLLPAARLAITRTIQDSTNKEQTFEEIIWQSSYDYESGINGLILYRSHGGINLEDKILEKNKDNFEREFFVPICSGLTFFKISAITSKDPVEKWNGSPPRGIVVTLSFAEPYKRADGTFDVPEEEKIIRTIAIDRTRKIRFDTSAGDFGGNEEGQKDVNLSGVEKPPTGGTRKAEKTKK
ncbi:MAG TPA: hypothetical protein DIU00_24545 [Phycisphaerales bacterium]|nr:hypothetical protein [Phycisphaerales bacterium]